MSDIDSFLTSSVVGSLIVVASTAVTCIGLII
jgi:hypothetical protein